MKSEQQRFDQVDKLSLDGRQLITLLDPEGRPVPSASVSVYNTKSGEIRWAAHTMSDGRIPVYPQLELPDGEVALKGPTDTAGANEAGSPWEVRVHAGDESLSQPWDGASPLSLTLDAPWHSAVGAREEIPIDVCFLIDTTGSMADEIAQIKATLLQVTEKLRRGTDRPLALRYSAVLYRDITDSYLTQVHPFTEDIDAFNSALQEISANGGGDGPESLNQGLLVTLEELKWSREAAKLAFLIADAPPHMDYNEEFTYGRSSLAALYEGIKVHTVAASGLNSRGSLVFRQIAQLTRGKFIYIEYGSPSRSAARHGVEQPGPSNNLDDIIFRQVQAEIKAWGAPAPSAKSTPSSDRAAPAQNQ